MEEGKKCNKIDDLGTQLTGFPKIQQRQKGVNLKTDSIPEPWTLLMEKGFSISTSPP